MLCVQALSARGKMHWKLSAQFVSNFCESAYDVKEKTKITVRSSYTRILHINATWIMELCSLKLKLLNLKYVNYPEGIFYQVFNKLDLIFFLGKHLFKNYIFTISLWLNRLDIKKLKLC